MINESIKTVEQKNSQIARVLALELRMQQTNPALIASENIEERNTVGDLILNSIFSFNTSRGEILSKVDELCTKHPLY